MDYEPLTRRDPVSPELVDRGLKSTGVYALKGDESAYGDVPALAASNSAPKLVLQ